MNPFSAIEAHSGSAPVPVFDVLLEIGLGPEFRSLDDRISGWIETKADGRHLVVINRLHARTRQRFTAAHALGHFIYHRDLLGAGAGDDRAYRSHGTPFPNPGIRTIHERQANTFAANLLMPADIVQNLQADGMTSPALLAARLGVSERVMRIRLGLP